MTPTHSLKNGARYRYYTSRALADGRKEEAGTVTSVPAPDVEAIVLDAVRRFHSSTIDPRSPTAGREKSAEVYSPGASGSADYHPQLSPNPERDLIAATIDRVVIMPTSIEVHLSETAAADRSEVISIAWMKPASRRRRVVLPPLDVGGEDRRAIRADAQAALVEAIAKARRWLDDVVSGKVDSIEATAAREGRSERSIRMTLSLAFLAPDIVSAVVSGAHPRGIGLSRLADLPVDWVDQRLTLGLSGP